MSASFLSLPGELRNQIYEHILVLGWPVRPGWPVQPWILTWKWSVTMGLLLVNKKVHRETTVFFYSRNVFDCSCGSYSKAISFLKRIGSSNAGYVRHLLLGFPDFTISESDKITLLDDDMPELLDVIRTNCPSLTTLEFSLPTSSMGKSKFGSHRRPELILQALELVDTRFRSIQSVQKLILCEYARCLENIYRKKLEDCGWTIILRDIMNEVDSDGATSGFNMYEDDDFDDFDDYDDHEDYIDYDVDDDSDFDS